MRRQRTATNLVRMSSALLLIVIASATSPVRGEEGSPNIIYILADDMGRGDVRCYTNKETAPVNSPVVTPSIDSIATASGSRCEHSMSTDRAS